MKLRQLRHFVALSESLNFSRAAITLHIAQPALSISIRNLEDEVGARLFERGPRRVALTQAGRMALPAARHALAYAEDFSRIASATAAGHAGILKMTFVGGATFRLLPERLPEFRRKFPDVELELTEGTTTDIIERVRSGAVDVGIVRHPLIRPTGLKAHVLETEPLVAAVHVAHPLASRRTIRLRELASQGFIQYSLIHAPSMHAVVALACQAAGFMPVVQQEAVQIPTILSLIESGLGVALVPASCAAVHRRKVRFIEVSDHKRALTVGLVMLTDPLNRLPLVQKLLDILSAD